MSPSTVETRRKRGEGLLEATLLTGVVAVDVGSWLDVSGYTKCTVIITGITTATVVVNVSNSVANPGDANHHAEEGNVTADGKILVDGPVRWIKARVSVWTSGTIEARLVGS